jgi:1-acyl-sn-glycerol-3-phosphate acyltransferase
MAAAETSLRAGALLDAVWQSPLGVMERAALALSFGANEWAPARRLASLWRRRVIAPLITSLCARRLEIIGLEHLANITPERGVLLAANHRSFFDLFVVANCLHDHTRLAHSLYFPVRSRFWYDNPLGLLINAVGAGMGMFPPVFRAGEKRPITRRGLDLLALRLSSPGTVVGMHPEGTRSRGADPYRLLPAEQSFGRVALLGKATVIPAFVCGLSNSLLREIARRKRDDAKICVAFGPPVDLSDFYAADPERLRHQLAAGERVLSAIHALGASARRRLL